MKLAKSRGLILITAAILLFNLVAVSQRRPNFDRTRTYDVQNYIIRVSFDWPVKKVFGDTTVQLKPLASGFRELELDAVGMSFESIKLDPAGTDLKYRTTSDKVIVGLDRCYSPDDLISVRFRYSTVPTKGVYFVDESKEQGAEFDAQIWSQGEAEENRYWFPSFDFPSDKATSEEFITVPKDQTVIGNGERLADIENADGTVTAHYKMPLPYSTYLTSFVIGKYVRVADNYGDIPLGFYVYPGKEAIAPLAFAHTKKMMQAFEELTGVKFPYNKYDQTIVRNFQFGGMENITATTHADTEVFMANYGFGMATVEDLVSHELSHSWFGDLVTCKTWAELWLNESFADFMEAAWRERGYGRDSYIRKLRSDAEQAIADDAINRHRHGLYNVLAKPDDSLFDTTTYQKGGTVVHMLREQVGNDVFWKAINIYLNRHKFDNVTTRDLQKAMEEASGQNLKWFFDQWVYGAGLPHLSVKQAYLPASKTLRVTITQTQKLDKITPAAFRLPLEVEITTGSNKRIEKINVTKRLQVFNFRADSRSTGVKIDPDEKIILKTVKIAPLTK
jgi:aminopeptidase N